MPLNLWTSVDHSDATEDDNMLRKIGSLLCVETLQQASHDLQSVLEQKAVGLHTCRHFRM